MIRGLRNWAETTRDDIASLELPQDLEERFGSYRGDPVGFVRMELGAHPEPYQERILQAAEEAPRLAWRAAHGVGKTTLLSWILLWWLLTRPFSRVLILAPAFERQVGRYLLPEVKKWVRNAPNPLPVKVRANTVEILGFEREWFALGVQATDPTMVEGGHAESLCVLADEAKGLDSEVVAALHGTQTDVKGDRMYFLASVPGGPSGPFYDVFHKGSRLWETFHTSAEDSAQVSRAWVEERREEWGAGSPLYVSRVLGEFPEEEEGTLFRLSDLEAAVDRSLEAPEGAGLAFGVDVARFGGDRSALAVWRGPALLSLTTQQGMDVMEVASWVASEINRQRPGTVRVDEIGIGAGVVDRLRQLGHRNVEAVSVSRSASKPELHANLRAEMFWKLREALEKGEVGLLGDEKLLAELSAIRYSFTASGQIRLEKKEETKKRVGHSPDLADAVALGFPGGLPEAPPILIGRASRSPKELREKGLAGPHLEPAFDHCGRLIR